MLENSILNLKPKKAPKIVVTKKKALIALVISLAFFTVLKIHANGSLQKELFYAKIATLVAAIRDPNDTATFNKHFTKGSFCGWEMVDVANNKTSSSDKFADTSKTGNTVSQEFDYNNTKYKMTLCIIKNDELDDSKKRQIFGALILAAIIVSLIYTTKFDEKTEKI
jgi:hypothetical protein